MRLAGWGLILLLMFIFGILLHDELRKRCGCAQGGADAQRDFETGKVGLKGCGKSMYWSGAFRRMLADNGVEYAHIAGCVPSPYQFGYRQGYNGAMKPFLDQHGVDLDQIAAEAKSRADARRERELERQQ